MQSTSVALVLIGLSVLGSGCDRRSLPPEASEEAHAAVEACASSGTEKQGCYETRLLAELDRAGVASALDLLSAIGTADREVESDGHVYTHAIGINAYSPDSPVAEVFGQCSTLYQSGCYHGVIQAHFIDKGIADETTIRELCEPYRSDEQRWLLFQCLHGLGHGLTMFYGHNLPRALEDCDYLRSNWDQESCYGGAFMENVVNATQPHHPAAALADGETDHEAEPEHDHGAMAGELALELEPFEPLRPEDPHYPCSTLEDRYLTACYMMQTSAMLWQNGGDVADAAKNCGEAPDSWRQTCFQSLGRDISSRTLQEPKASLRECRKAPEEFREWCYVGLVKNFIDLTASTDDGFSFCTQVEEWAKPRCNEAIGEEIGILHATRGERRIACLDSETPELGNACLRGARVPVS